ncbi:MAG: tRNA pseudouridine(38-40) synthase TruA [Alphaproteobacteria bacterium]
MTRYKFVIEYDGRPFVGWQRQQNGPSVQAALEEAVYRFCGERITVTGGGRTDTGVHALGQVAHLDLNRDVTGNRLRDAVNAHLRPLPVAVVAAMPVNPEFHARFSAIGRRYLFRILSRRAPPAIEEGRVWWVPQSLDAEVMHTAGQILVGRHDFTSFRAAGCQATSPIKTLNSLRVFRHGDEVWLEVLARSFLHNQVRIIMGTLCQVGLGRWPASAVEKALTARNRSAAGPTAPAQGLYLVAIHYEDENTMIVAPG